MKASGSSQNTSIRAEGIPSFVGLSQPLFAGSPTKKGASAISSPATDPRFHSSTAPSARMYDATASRALGTATITEIRGGFAKLSCRLTELALKLRATRPPAHVSLNDSSCAPAHKHSDSIKAITARQLQALVRAITYLTHQASQGSFPAWPNSNTSPIR